MDTTKLSSKGQVIIPKRFRQHLHWETGQELTVVATADGVLLKPSRPFAETTLAEVAGCLPYTGTPKTLEEMEQAIARGAQASGPLRIRSPL